MLKPRVLRVFALVFSIGGAVLFAGDPPPHAPLRVSEGHFDSEHGYVSSKACRDCHSDQYGSWHASYHRTMTQAVGPDTTLGDFDGVALTLPEGVYRLTRREDRFFVETPDGLESPVVQSTGSHHYQLYWRETGFGRELELLPFAWLKEQGRWVPRTSVFLAPPDSAQDHLIWNVNCIPCHSTNGRPSYRLQAEGPAKPDTRVAELGIACEACHGPGAKHVETQSPADIVHPGKLPAPRAAEVCGQCHSVNIPYASKDWAEWLLDGPLYRPGDRLEDSRYVPAKDTLDRSPLLAEWMRKNPDTLDGWFWSDGEVRVTGREMNALRASPCYRGGELSCLSCHSPHADDPDDLLTVPRTGNDGCTQCHQEMAANKVLEAHTRHPADSAGSRCYNCHMPNTVYGLLKATRSHQITNPTVRDDVAVGRPNACSLCHLDRPLSWAAAALSEWYGVPEPRLSGRRQAIAAGPLGLLTGDAGERALWAWHFAWAPALEASGRDWQAPFLAATLEDPYDAVRYIAARSLRALPGYQDFSFDFIAPPDERAAAARRALEAWSPTDAPSSIPTDSIKELLADRDDRPVTLAE